MKGEILNQGGLTVEQMLVVLVVIEITGVLLYTGVDAKRARIGLLDSEIIGFQLAINLTLLLTVLTSDPDALDVGAADDVVPVVVGAAVVLLGEGEERVLIHALREEASNLIPEFTSLIRERLQLLLECVQRLGEPVGTVIRRDLGRMVGTVLGTVTSKDLLEGRDGRSGRSNQHSSWKNSHCAETLRGWYEIEMTMG